MDNPLLNDFGTPFDTVPFSKIENKHFQPAIEQAIASTKAEIDLISKNSEDPTFENTLEALEYSGEKLNRISSLFFNLNRMTKSKVLRKLYRLY